jgi:hypothetical protein
MQELEIYSMIGVEGFTRLVATLYPRSPQNTFHDLGWASLQLA